MLLRLPMLHHLRGRRNSVELLLLLLSMLLRLPMWLHLRGRSNPIELLRCSRRGKWLRDRSVLLLLLRRR